MAYEVLARKYRSQDFSSLVGQEPIARTLQNAIASDRIAHAYLFCGTRGVGKTSTARIFAKAINVTPDLRQPEEIARAIMKGEDLDVIEIDAASNNSVDNARELIANAAIQPARCKYKIYIVDEVHMLSQAAFNALLKTMEEPPKHVIFILCTTESHKVPATIQSRCQRFDFRPISTARIADHLREVLKSEQLKAEPEVIQRIALLGNGSMRDALSVLDRLLAAGESTLTMKLLEEMLGLPDRAMIVGLVDAIVANDAASALRAGHELLSRGTSVEQALELLTQYLRDMMVIAACGAESGLVELSDEALGNAKSHASEFDTAALVHMIAVCDATTRNVSHSSIARAQFDAAIARLCMTHHLADIERLLGGGGNSRPVAPRDASTAAGGGIAGASDGGVKKKAVERADDKRGRQQFAPPDSKTKETGTAGVIAAAVGTSTGVEPITEGRAIATGDGVDKPSDGVDGHEIWRVVLERATKLALPRIEHMEVIGFDGQTLRLRMGREGYSHLKWFRNDPQELTELVQKATGRRIKALLELNEGESICEEPELASGFDLETIRGSETIRTAMDLFGAKIIGAERIDKVVEAHTGSE